jgi:biotin carboxyl carrier protein
MNYRARTENAEVALALNQVAPAAGGWSRLSISVDGGPVEDVVGRIEGDLVTFQWRGRFHHARLAPAQGAPPGAVAFDAMLRGEGFSIEISRDSAGLRAAASKKSGAPMAVKAPMPGRVVAVNVKQGDTVARGDLLLTLEAMKMQNEFSAPVAGRILEVRTAVGAIAAADDVLVMIEPAKGG